MHLAVNPVAHAVGFGEIAHFLDVALKRVEIQHKAGRLDIGLVHARQSGHVKADFEIVKCYRLVHFSILT